MFIDTHSHITDTSFGPSEEEQVIARAKEAGVGIMLQADVDSRERGAMYEAVKRHPGVLYPMLGLYPGSVGEDWRDEIDRMLPFLSAHPVAVGEIGLDYHYGADTAALQKEAFAAQLELALGWGLPVNIHLREATADFFDILEGFRGRGLKGNLHAFSGSYETFCRLGRYGDFRVGIGGVVTFKKASLAQTVKQIPLESIVLETDAPYLAPTPLRGTRNESANIPIIARFIAGLKETTPEEVERTTTLAALDLFPGIALSEREVAGGLV